MRKSTSTAAMILMAALPWASAQAPGGRKSAPPLVDELRQAYKGAALRVQQPGLMGLPINYLAVAVATFEDGKLKQPGWSDRTFNAANAAWFQPGDRVIAEKFDVDSKHDKITFTLVKDDRTFKAGLHFKFAKGYLNTAAAGPIYDVIGQVLAFENNGNNAPPQQPQPQSQVAPPPPAAPPMRTPPPPPPASAPTEGAAVAPLMWNGQPIGFGPAGAVLMPPDQPPASADGRPWIPVVREGKIVAYAPPGSTIWGQPAPGTPAPSPAAAPAEPGPPTIKLGQTGEEVQAILGAPDKIANLGSKVIFFYKDLKVTLTEGKVSDVQ